MTTICTSQTTVRNSKGFTLIELMIALFVSSIIMAAIAVAYQSQQKSQTALSQRIEMQQQLRSLMNFLSSEIRIAGIDPTINGNFGVVSATAGRFRFTMDVDGDGNSTGANEDIEYGFSLADDLLGDGVADAGVGSFCRRRNNIALPTFDTLADNIVAVEFLYVLDDTNGNNQYDPVTTLTPTAAQLNDIRAVTISILIRTANPDNDFTNNLSYTSASGAIWTGFNDNFRRQLLITNIKLRDIGL